MYILLIGVHAVFILLSHIFGFFLLEGVFIVLLLFFLLYFSPIFFFKNEKSAVKDLFSFDLSPQKSLIIPLILTYIGIYILTFTFSWGMEKSIHIHVMIFMAIYGVLSGYMVAFYWKNDVFFDITRFHLLCSYITLVIIGIYFYFFREGISFLEPLFGGVVLIFSYFFFSYERKASKEIFHFFLLSSLFILELTILSVFPGTELFMLVGITGLFSLSLFELSKKEVFFEPYLQITRAFFLTVVLIVAFFLVGFSFSTFESIYFLIPLILFLFSVHIRYGNVVSYGSGTLLLFFLYSFVFHSLLSSGSIFTTFIFVFFFSFVLIGNTYFWEEKQQYDFAIIHYSSILFSVFSFLYSIFFLHWESSLFIFLSFWIFLLAGLFVLSYFRFRKL